MTAPFRGAGMQAPQGWGIDELNRLLASGRTMPGVIGQVPAGRWWPAFMLTIVDTGAFAPFVLQTAKTAFDSARALLAVDALVYSLHPLTFDALDYLRRFDGDALFPWPYDGGKPPFHMLFRKMKEVVFRANLPATRTNLFDRLRRTSKSASILDSVDLSLTYTPRSGQPPYPRKRDIRKQFQLTVQRESCGQRLTNPITMAGELSTKPAASLPEDSLLRFYEERYLAARPTLSKTYVRHFRTAFRMWEECLGTPATFSHLNDDSVEHFLAWYMRTRAVGAVSRNNYRRYILAVWRFAWRKRKVAELPRDVSKIPEPKRLPESWSLDELRTLLATAQTFQFHKPRRQQINLNDWLVAMILTIYYTGLRRRAINELKTADVNLETGWLTAPAEVQKDREALVFKLPTDCIAAIRRIYDANRQKLFGIYTVHSLSSIFQRVVKASGLPDDRSTKFHKIRRTSATLICAASDEQTAQRHLGHSHISVTKRYIDPRFLPAVNPTELLPKLQLKSTDGVV